MAAPSRQPARPSASNSFYIAERLTACRAELERLKSAIEAKKVSLADGGLASVPGARRALGAPLQKRRTLHGHFGKVHALDWASDGYRIVTAGQDSKLLIWDAMTSHKLQSIPLKVTWAMAVAFSPEDRFVACGGLDNIVTLYNAAPPPAPTHALAIQAAAAARARASLAASALGEAGSEAAPASLASSAAAGAVGVAASAPASARSSGGGGAPMGGTGGGASLSPSTVSHASSASSAVGPSILTGFSLHSASPAHVPLSPSMSGAAGAASGGSGAAASRRVHSSSRITVGGVTGSSTAATTTTGAGTGSVSSFTGASSAAGGSGSYIGLPGAPPGGGMSASSTPGDRKVELHGHEGYVSAVRFNSPTTLLTASGDSRCTLWDIHRGAPLRHFIDHGSDVLCLAVSPVAPHIFATGSVDTTARVWDTRTSKCVQVFSGHEGDVNGIAFLPSGMGLGTAGDDASCKVFDLRSHSRLNNFAAEAVSTEATSIAFSASGRLLFAGHDDCNVLAWDTLAEEPPAPAYALAGHAYRVTCLATNNTGEALATGSWDTDIGIWA